jgi:membrane-associated phospholipid phosphatase
MDRWRVGYINSTGAFCGRSLYRRANYGFAKSLKASLICVLICCFFATGLKANAENLLSHWDQTLFERIYDAPPHQEPMWTLMEGISDLGDYRGVMGASILLMAYGNESHRETGKLLSSAYMGAGIITYGMKRLVGRKRPLDETLGNPAMPSGHASIVFSVATILGYQYPKWRIPLYIGAGLVSFSRVYLGRHYTSDVIAGAAIGTATGVLVWHKRVTLLKWEF